MVRRIARRVNGKTYIINVNVISGDEAGCPTLCATIPSVIVSIEIFEVSENGFPVVTEDNVAMIVE